LATLDETHQKFIRQGLFLKYQSWLECSSAVNN